MSQRLYSAARLARDRGFRAERIRTAHFALVDAAVGVGVKHAPFFVGRDFREVEKKVSQSGSELVELQATVRQLQARVDRHSLVIQVLKEMLLSQGGFSEDGFLERLGRAVAQKADDKTCRKCGKAMSAKHNRCMYCGEQRPSELL